MPSCASKPAAMSARKRNRKSQNHKHTTPLLPPDIAEDEVDISDDDIGFVAQHGRYAGFLSNLDMSTITKQVLGLKPKKKDEENLEAYYEKKAKYTPSFREEAGERHSVEPADVLPVKTLSGELLYRTSHVTKHEGEKETSLSLEDRKVLVRKAKPTASLKQTPEELSNKQEKADKGRQNGSEVDSKNKQKRAQKVAKEVMNGEIAKTHVSPALQSLALEELRNDVSAEERLAQARVHLAELGTVVLANPENNMDSLKELQKFCTDKDGNIARLAMLSLLAVYKDIIPGYRIRIPTAKELEMQVSKEVRKVRDFETNLLRLYQKYIQILASSVNSSVHYKPALRCVCGLLEAIPHFNYRDSLLSIVVPQLDSSDVLCRKMSCDALKSLFQNEGKHGGVATVEAVQMIADFVKASNCVLRPDTLEVFLALSFDEDLNRPVSTPEKGKSVDNQKSNRQEKKQKKSKKHQLAEKLREEVLADFKESSALQDTSERRQLQTQTLSAVFETYFRILKASLETSDRVQEFKATGFQRKLAEYGPRPLLRPCLDGLAKFSNLISVEFMGDLLAVLKRLAAEASVQNAGDEVQDGFPLTFADRLQCCVVAFRIVRSNLDALKVDLRDFYIPFYNLLLSHDFVRDEHNAEVLAGALQVMLWESRQHDMQRVSAFVKRLASQSLQLGSAEAMAALVTVQHLLQRYKKCCNLLENDGGGGAVGGNIAVFQQDGTDPDLSGALSSVLWEITLLSRHYHPGVANLASQISTMATIGEIVLATVTPKDALHVYCTSKGGFHPSVQPPKRTTKRKSYASQHGVQSKTSEDLLCYCNALDAEFCEGETDELFASHFRVLRAIKENEALRKEQSLALRSIALFKKFKANKNAS